MLKYNYSPWKSNWGSLKSWVKKMNCLDRWNTMLNLSHKYSSEKELGESGFSFTLGILESYLLKIMSIFISFIVLNNLFRKRDLKNHNIWCFFCSVFFRWIGGGWILRVEEVVGLGFRVWGRTKEKGSICYGAKRGAYSTQVPDLRWDRYRNQYLCTIYDSIIS